ncbi:MAG: hypothetical protein F4Y91_17310 [Gemmatimonadetes bacterium]|nr:hypothetical protein [Gemmatimonadota bacterium]MYB69041.1 hypothetical protein [Gemmatimonadota bacterium]
MKRTMTLGVLILGWVFAAQAAEGTINGYMFGDYYYVLAADEADAKQPHKRNAFRFRRVYFTYQKAIATDFAVRFRLEATDTGFGEDAKMEPFLKHGYLQWKQGLGDADLYLGLSGTPTWAVAEKVWGYRSIAKTVLDWNKIGSSADLGAALKGSAGQLRYHLMVGNGPGQKPEDDHGKKFYGSLSFKAADRLVLEGYADFNARPAGRNERTFKGFVGWQGAKGKAGLEVFSRTHERAGDSDEDHVITGVSAFGSLPLSAVLKGFGRIDAVARDAEDTTDWLFIAGLDYSPATDVHLMPNAIVEAPAGHDANVQGRLTFFYKF